MTKTLFVNLKRPWAVNHHRLFLAPSPAFVGVITTSMGSTHPTTHPSPSFPTKTCAAGMWMVGAKIATSTDLGSAPTPLKASLSSGNWLKHLENRSKNTYWDIIRRMVRVKNILNTTSDHPCTQLALWLNNLVRYQGSQQCLSIGWVLADTMPMSGDGESASALRARNTSHGNPK